MNKTTANYITGACFLLLLGYLIYYYSNIKHKFESDQVEKSIAIGVIVEYNAGARNAPDFEYEFKVGDNDYESRHLIVTKLGQKSGDELRKYIGKEYQVWYVVDDPTYNRLLLNKPILNHKEKD